MIIDAHAHVGPEISDPLKRRKVEAIPGGTVEDYIRDMDEAGIDMGIVFGRLDMDNQYLAEAQKQYPDRIVSCAFINPKDDDPVEEFKRCVYDWGMRGLKLNGLRHSYPYSDHELLDPLLEICSENGLPVIMHCSGDNFMTTPVQIEEMARTFPKVKFIAAHGGNLWLAEEGTQVSSRTKNVIMDTSLMEEFRITHNSKVLDKGNLVMGSHWPFYNLIAIKDKVARCVQDEETLEWVRGRAIAEIFRIDYK